MAPKKRLLEPRQLQELAATAEKQKAGGIQTSIDLLRPEGSESEVSQLGCPGCWCFKRTGNMCALCKCFDSGVIKSIENTVRC